MGEIICLVEVPAEYKAVKHEILFETNTTLDVVGRMQRAFEAAGYSPGPIGVVVRETFTALEG